MSERCQCESPKALFYCRFPPPATGETIGSQLVFDLVSQRIPSTAVEALGNRRQAQRGGAFRAGIAVRYALRLLRLWRRLRRDRVHSFYFVPASSRWGHLRDLIVLAAVRRHVCRVVAHIRSGNFHETVEQDPQPVRRWFLKRVDAFVFLADLLSERAANCIPDQQRFVVPNSIDQEVVFSETEIAEKLQSRSNRTRLKIVFISNMHATKGYQDLEVALGKLDSSIAWLADFIGGWPSDEQQTQFQDRIAASPQRSQIRVHGPIDCRATIKQTLAEADIFVLPTYYPVEAQPRSIIEALNSATPVIVTPHASIPEYVSHDVNGYLVQPQSPAEIAAAIVKLADPEVWQQKALAARRTYLDRFQADLVAEQLTAVLVGREFAAARELSR